MMVVPMGLYSSDERTSRRDDQGEVDEPHRALVADHRAR